MKAKLEALAQNHTCRLVPLPVSHKPIVANKFTKSNIDMMELLNVTKLVLLLRDTL